MSRFLDIRCPYCSASPGVFCRTVNGSTRPLHHARKAEPTNTCTGCGHDDPDELQPGPSGDPYCGDCRTTHAEASPYAY